VYVCVCVCVCVCIYIYIYTYNFTVHLSKDQPEDGPTNRAETYRWNRNLI